MPDPLRQVALVSETTHVTMSQLTQASAAYQKQITRDFGPLWNVDATVDVFDKLEDVPLGYWPIILRDDINSPGAGGFHSDEQGQPFALVLADPGVSTADWQLAASHECLEMLADPFGNRVIPGDSPKSDQGRVEFLVEVCDPSEASQFAYTVNGVLVSDFYTLNYHDPVVSPGVRYSIKGYITEPRQVLKGGYLSWHEPETNHWWQKFVGLDGNVQFVDLGILSVANGSIRSQIDRLTAARTRPSLKTKDLDPVHVGLRLTAIAPATNSRAVRLHATIKAVIDAGGPDDGPNNGRRPPGNRE